LKHFKSFDVFVNESTINESQTWKTKKIKQYDDLEYSDFIADGPNPTEISMIRSVSNRDMSLIRIWSSDPSKKIGEPFKVDMVGKDQTVFQVVDKNFDKLIIPWLKQFFKENPKL